MRTAAAAMALGLTLIAAAALAACAPEDPVPPPSPGPSRTPVFASEEEALAAAEDSYIAYLAVANVVAQEGGVDPDRFAEVTTEAWLQIEVDSAHDLQATGNRQVGDVTLVTLNLQSLDASSEDAEQAAYACLDLSAVQFVDSEGNDVTATDRDTVVPIEVFFQSSSSDPIHLLIASNEPWPGQNFCL